MQHSQSVVVTGSSGLLGSHLVRRLARSFNVIGLDRAGPPYPPIEAECISADMTSPASIGRALERVRYAYGERLAGVVHLAAYYDFSGADSDLYQKLTVEGTRTLLRLLRTFDVGVFVFSSTMLVHAPCEPGERIDEDWPLRGGWPYPDSKIQAERVIREEVERPGSAGMPAVALRIAGVYDDRGHSIPLAQQIRRIDAERLTSKVFPGDVTRGQAFVHLDDAVEALALAVERGGELPRPSFTPILIGEPETLSYDELQRAISALLLGEEIRTRRIPETVARVGAWLQDVNPLGEDPFIKPWMIPLADEHYALDISRARRLLGWAPRRSLRETIPRIIDALKRDPEAWYRENGLEPPAGSEAAQEHREGGRAS